MLLSQPAQLVKDINPGLPGALFARTLRVAGSTLYFVADDGTIVNLVDMKPQTTDSHCSAQPVRFVLEMNQGWFAKRGLKAGSRLGGPAWAESCAGRGRSRARTGGLQRCPEGRPA